MKSRKNTLVWFLRNFCSQNNAPLCRIAGTNYIFDPPLTPPLAPSSPQPQLARPKKSEHDQFGLWSSTTFNHFSNIQPPCIAHSWDWALLVCSAFGGDSQLHGCQRYRVTSRLSTSLPVFWHLKTHPGPYLFFIPFKILPHLIFLYC